MTRNTSQNMKKKDEKEKMEKMHQKKVEQMRKTALGFCTKSRSQHHGGEEEPNH